MNSEQESGETKKIGLLLFSLILWVTAFGCILGSLPKFQRMYEEMLPGEALPLLTRLICNIPPAGYAVAMITGIVSLLFMHHITPDASSRRAVSMVVGLLSILLFIVYVTGLFLPLVTMIEGLGG